MHTDTALEAAKFMQTIFLETVRENKKGQCTQGHSCKLSSLEKLQQTIEVIVEQDSSIDIPRQ